MRKQRGVWLVWCAVLGVLYLFENDTATRMLWVCSLVLPLFDGLLTAIAVRRLQLALHAPHQAEKGSAIPLDIRIDRALPPVVFRARIRCENLLTGETGSYTAWVRRSGIRHAAHRCLLHTGHCGMLSVQLTVEVCGFFGLFERSAVAEKQAVIWVPPVLLPLHVVPSEADAAREDRVAGVSRPLFGSEDAFAVRAYMPGDSVRLIHWKLSEKLDTVMVRAAESPLSDQLLLGIDLSSAANASAIDRMTQTLFSLSHALLGSGIPHSLYWLASTSAQPELRRIETEADYASFEADYFSITPHRSLSLVPDEAAAGYAHALLVGGPPLAQAFAAAQEQRITLLTDAPDPHDLPDACRILPLPDAGDMILML